MQTRLMRINEIINALQEIHDSKGNLQCVIGYMGEYGQDLEILITPIEGGDPDPLGYSDFVIIHAKDGGF